MSKKVTVASNPVNIEGNTVVRGSDGLVYYPPNSSVKKGDEIADWQVVLTKKGIAAVEKAAPIISEIEKLKAKLEKISTSECTDFEDLDFTNSEGEACVRVGCTCVYPDELPKIMKALGI